MIERKVFLSSAFKDLAKYREAVYHAIQRMDGWRCVRMEDFGARDWEADDFCRKKVSECDVFVGILGLLYGSVHKASGLSYTQREYEAAADASKPRLMFLTPEDFPVPGNLMESTVKQRKQRGFRKGVEEERVRDANWTSPDQLATSVVTAIYNWAPGEAPGRSDLITDPGYFQKRAAPEVLTGPLPFDHLPCERASLADLDLRKVERFLSRDKVRMQDDWTDGLSDPDQLSEFQLFKDPHPTYGALLCFGKSPQTFLPSAVLRCIRWRGKQRTLGWDADEDHRGDIVSQFERGISFLRENLRFRKSITEDGRAEDLELPRAALEEALANALVHRIYHRYDSHDALPAVDVQILEDRVEISSPGGPPPPMTMELLGAEDTCYPRNPLIARIFYLYGFVEKAGSGIRHMQQRLAFAGLPKAHFELSGASTFKVVFRRPKDFIDPTESYLKYIADRYSYLDFRGMGVSDRVPLRVELLDLYVPAKARVQLPRGDTWDRQVGLGGDQFPVADMEALGEHVSEPQDVARVVQEHDGLIILGDPGSGKTTFLKSVALQMARRGGQDSRLPVLVPVSAYANALADKDVRLDDFIADYLHSHGAEPAIRAVLGEALIHGRAVIMLDGLDEVRDQTLQEKVVRMVVDFYTFHHRAGNKLLLTSRIIGYRVVRRKAEGLAECTLLDFGDEEIETFVTGWVGALEKAARGDTLVASAEAEREKRELLDAIHRNSGVRHLAGNPLLLTVLALMKRQGVRLPDRRVELYDNYVKVLLASWNRARSLDLPLPCDLDVEETTETLARLAHWMHRLSPGVGLVEEAAARERLVVLSGGVPSGEGVVERFLKSVREHSGLLVELGPGQYGFIHLTFEEYLAAVGLAQLGQTVVKPVVDELKEHVGDPAWREVTLLTVGYLGIVQRRKEAADGLVEGLLTCGKGRPGEAVVLAGDAVADIWPGGVTAETKENVVGALLETLNDDARIEALLRSAAGNTLYRLGDPRFRTDAWFLPDGALLGFVEVPAGPFLMGSDRQRDKEAYDNEQPQHKLHLPAYYIGRWPVTQAQFAAFVEAGGYASPQYWNEAIKAKVWKDGKVKGGDDEEPREGPVEMREPFNLGNHPVVGITWYEALAYCRWLEESLREWERTPEELGTLLRTKGWRVSLPSEAQWEKAARGTDGRIYPWGDEPDPSRANYDNTGIRTTSAVGCFPEGRSPCGCEDVSGNVWEWTRSVWGEGSRFRYPYHPEDGREDLVAAGSERWVVRGGSFSDDERNLRCAYHNRSYPYFRHNYVGFRVVVSPL